MDDKITSTGLNIDRILPDYLVMIPKQTEQEKVEEDYVT